MISFLLIPAILTAFGASTAAKAQPHDPFANSMTTTANPDKVSKITRRLPKPFHVVIDPGHGGVDHGTTVETSTGQAFTEKHLTLLFAQSVAEQLRARGFRVTLTRTADVDLPLGPRTALANKLGADVFISIHMNSTQTPMIRDAAEGVETYILNNTTDASSRSLARLENTVLGPKTKNETPEEVDVALILRDLRLDANMAESKKLACSVQRQLIKASDIKGTRSRNRGVRQALFHVLLGAEMPSILVEAGFLNNARDRNLLLDHNQRRTMAMALTRAVEAYRDARNSPNKSESLSRCQVH